MRKVEVVPHDPRWQAESRLEAERVAKALSAENVAALHHIGSTAIPDIYAKPIIDLLVEVKDVTKVDEQNPPMELLGYEAMGEYGIPGRRYFRKESAIGVRTHHVHVFQSGSPEVERHLAFRDYMIAHPQEAQRYSQLKRELAQEHPGDIEAYMDGKDAFIKQIDMKATQWRRAQSR